MFTLRFQHPTGARRGVLHTQHGEVQTPFFMPIATQGTVKTVPPHELAQLEQHVDPTTTPIVLTNTYHLALRPGEEVLRHYGGVHEFLRWPYVVLTDSGGFQVFSLARLRTIDNDGVLFRSHIDGGEQRLTPERSMELQSSIGADVCMVFDYFPGYPADPTTVARSVQLTTAWAQRCRTWWDAHATYTAHQQLFGIVQGGVDSAARTESVAAITGIGFDGYAIGGLAVGESEEELYRMVEVVAPLLPLDRPRYVMGVGTPDQLLECVKRGVDMFDCVLPTRNARHGSIFIHDATHPTLVAPDLSHVYYQRLNVRSEVNRMDPQPLDPHCSCDTCTVGYSRGYIRHLFSVNELVAARLATVHNVHVYLTLMVEIRHILDESQ